MSINSFREKIALKIKENRPKLTDSSAKTYVSILFNLHKNMEKETDNDLSWFNDDKQILLKLKDIAPKIRKTTLSALFILTNNEHYQKLMVDDCKIANNEYREQKKTETEKDNWVTMSEIKTIYDDLFKQMKKALANKNISIIMNYFLLALLGGQLANLPPRRSLDYCLLKIRNYDKNIDNYYEKGKFYFNKYKTQPTYGLQSLDVPIELNSVIKKWIKLNKTDYLLYSSNEKPLSSPQITRMLNAIFAPKKVSTDLLRHIFLTDKYKDVPPLLDIDKTALEMGHSPNQAMLYIKR